MVFEVIEVFNGIIELDICDLELDWGLYVVLVVLEYLLNILYLVWDDVGIVIWDCFGGLVEMFVMMCVVECGV